jgi:hypothetical protein
LKLKRANKDPIKAKKTIIMAKKAYTETENPEKP